MTKMLKSLLVCLLALSSLAGLAHAQVSGASQLPADARFDRKVTMNLPAVDLETYLKTLGSSVGLQVIPTNVPAVQVSLVFKDLPFRQVWNNIIAIYGLDFVLQPNDLVIVGPRESIAALKPQAPSAQPAPAAKTEIRNYTVKSDPVAIKTLIETQFPAVKVSAVGSKLIVTATAEQHTAIQALLNEVDVAPAPVPVEAKPEIRNYTIKGDPAATRTLIETQFPGVKISIVGNKLVITATPAQQTQIAAVISDVDVAPPPPAPVATVATKTETVALSYAKAVKLADVLQKVISGTTASSGASANATASAQATTLPGQTSTTPLLGVTVIAEESSNSLIINGPVADVDRLLKIIPALDKPQQLVNVGVRIQEVSDEAGRNLGIDWSFGIGNFSGSIASGALNFVLDATRSLAGLNIGAALNALETQRLSKRVNDSTLTVLNNGTGLVKVGGRIEITSQTSGTSGSTTAQSGLASRTLNYGVEVQVTPSIAADGNITLETSALVSSVLNPNSTDFQRIDFIDRSSKSTVRLRDGQTMLLGSLLQTIEDSSTSGIPFISSIPLIGDAFKKSNSSSTQTQVIIVVTVNIIK
jgi:type II secretory pathway component GspD/PulD (secretin)